jgi:hypothetical protein
MAGVAAVFLEVETVVGETGITKGRDPFPGAVLVFSALCAKCAPSGGFGVFNIFQKYKKTAGSIKN